MRFVDKWIMYFLVLDANKKGCNDLEEYEVLTSYSNAMRARGAKRLARMRQKKWYWNLTR